jgi:hypothetical protein
VVVLGDGGAVVAATHADEVDTPAAALAAAHPLHADAVLATGGADGAGLLAVALAESPPRPLLLVRGAAAVPGADALLLEQPRPAGGPSQWLAPVLRALEGRLALAREPGIEAAPLRAFPARAGRSGPAALLWLSPRARRALAGSDTVAALRPEWAALAATRDVGTIRGDLAAWVAAGRGAPDAQALEAAERLARTRDAARLRPRAGAARLSVFVDEARGLAAFAIEAGTRRAAALAGDRREVRVRAATAAEADAALFAGARTLVAGGGT